MGKFTACALLSEKLVMKFVCVLFDCLVLSITTIVTHYNIKYLHDHSLEHRLLLEYLLHWNTVAKAIV